MQKEKSSRMTRAEDTETRRKEEEGPRGGNPVVGEKEGEPKRDPAASLVLCHEHLVEGIAAKTTFPPLPPPPLEPAKKVQILVTQSVSGEERGKEERPPWNTARFVEKGS